MSILTMYNKMLRFCPGLAPEIIKSIIQDSYEYHCQKDYNKLKLFKRMSTVAIYSTGTVAVTSGGVVTPTGGTFAASMVGSFMKVYYDDAYFEIGSYDAGTGKVTLLNWTGVVVAAGTNYSIFKTIYTLDTAFGVLYDVTYQLKLTKKSQAYFNELDPYRSSTSDSPLFWAFAGVSPTTNALKIEIWPVPTSVVSLGLDGKQAFSTLSDSAVLLLPESLIESHALMGCYAHKDVISPNEGWYKREAEQRVRYQLELEQFEEEDYIIGQSSEKVRDKMFGVEIPTDDNYALSHDVD